MNVFNISTSIASSLTKNVAFRCIFATSSAQASTVAGKYKVTKRRNFPLTYEMAQKPFYIGVRKSWLSWNTSFLEEMSLRQPQTILEDEFIRKFIDGTWHRLFAENVIIKRRGNLIVIAGIIVQKMPARKIYWLIGYTEELLSHLFKQPVRMEVQTIGDQREIIFKYI